MAHKDNGFKAGKKLNLGCGKLVKKGYVNLDSVKLKGVDVVHDLEKFPYPFKDNEFDEIYCSHLLEHLSDLIKVMKELRRILKPKGKLKVVAPYFSNPGSFSDPTHKRFFTYTTFDYFDSSSGLSYYSDARFKIIKKRIQFTTSSLTLPIDWLINLFPNFYQRFFSYILPSAQITYELEAVK